MLKSLLIVLFIIVQCKPQNFLQKSPELDKALAFTYGFFTSMRAFETIVHGSACNETLHQLKPNVQKVIELLQNKTAQAVADAFQLMGVILKNFSVGCGAAGVETFEYSSELFGLIFNSTNMQEGMKRIQDNIFYIMKQALKGTDYRL